MKMALDKVAFLPFGKLIDQWRWDVFAGEITPADYNKAWWELRAKYQGVVAAGAAHRRGLRSGREVPHPGNTPYTRYFLSFILQFQFHQALCEAAGLQGPAARVLDLRQQGSGQEVRAPCSRWARASLAGRAREAHRHARRWTRRRSSSTSSRSKPGSKNRTRARTAAGTELIRSSSMNTTASTCAAAHRARHRARDRAGDDSRRREHLPRACSPA